MKYFFVFLLIFEPNKPLEILQVQEVDTKANTATVEWRLYSYWKDETLVGYSDYNNGKGPKGDWDPSTAENYQLKVSLDVYMWYMGFGFTERVLHLSICMLLECSDLYL